MAHNVFVAIGGSGTKVAEALVRLLAIGFPTTRNAHGVLTSAGDSLDIWRLDPDLTSASAEDLATAIEEYETIQQALSDGAQGTNGTQRTASSTWAMDLKLPVREFNPLLVDGPSTTASTDPTLKSFLGSDKNSALLNIFYEDKDLEVEIDRGFYQKPFIGAAVMGLFAAALATINTNANTNANLSGFGTNQVRFFLCGSLHGGTGACGLPVIGSFLKSHKGKNNWQLGAGLLAPYSMPTSPPVAKLAPGTSVSQSDIDNCVKELQELTQFKNVEEKLLRPLALQLLNGFYADPDDLVERAAQGFRYFRQHVASDFDVVFVAGKEKPDVFSSWSNGGVTQKNPSNTTELVMAIAALGFFAGTAEDGEKTCLVPRATSTSEGKDATGLLPEDIPSIQVLSHTADSAKVTVQLDKVLLATAVLRHLVLRQIPWGKDSKLEWPNVEKLWSHYEHHRDRINSDQRSFSTAFESIKKAIDALLVRSHTVGWSGNPGVDLDKYFSDSDEHFNEVTSGLIAPKIRLPFFKADRLPLAYGRAELLTTVVEFGKWGMSGATELDRGDYLRRCWSELYSRC